ncbi:hypothetical protein [Bacteroidetes bacterium endosymbiont of Geopemphigus sp.]|uniref:hypothetical protein n=1 Tax=Bacteroidetes bacterium endosymbiont of Geopemphigus sp. TaxID=2047937 RepID=UPI0011AF7A0D|nr:hypothetical protein [Bacteroidetes bacterium endosymbiont of Geopemphigus sp.]
MDFTSDKVRLNGWYVRIYGGIPILHSADFRSFTKEKKGIGYDVQLSVNKEITHSFALQLFDQYRSTKQYSALTKED